MLAAFSKTSLLKYVQQYTGCDFLLRIDRQKIQIVYSETIKPVFLNLFRAVAHLKGPKIFAAHFNKNFNAIIIMSLG